MILRRLESPDAVADWVAERLHRLTERKARPTVALPTGETPLRLYGRLLHLVRQGAVELSGVRWFSLDEFCGDSLPESATFRHFLLERFILPAGLRPDALRSLSHRGEPEQEALAFEQSIRDAGGIDLAILGIGGNGHIAFNEPGTPFDSRTGTRSLEPGTVAASRYLFPPEVPLPTMGLTMGIGTLMAAREVILMATGSHKAAIVRALVDAEPDEHLPASALKNHPCAHVVVDRAAASLL
jgi:glucosamine-6-phosphate deaminase